MKVEHHPVGAQRVGRCGRNLVDAHFNVAVLDPVIDGAHVDVRDGRAVAKVHRDTRGGAETLQWREATAVTPPAPVFESTRMCVPFYRYTGLNRFLELIERAGPAQS